MGGGLGSSAPQKRRSAVAELRCLGHSQVVTPRGEMECGSRVWKSQGQSNQCAVKNLRLSRKLWTSPALLGTDSV